MSSARSQHVRAVLADVLAASPADRAAALATARAHDVALGRELEALLTSTRIEALFGLPASPTLISALRGADATRQDEGARLQPGTRLGPYEVLRRLGAGGMGEVYLARDTRLHRNVALKCVARRLQGDEAGRARTLREARAAATLSHPAIADIYDVLDHADGTVVIVMEYVQGQSLAERMRRGRLEPLEAVDIAITVADALAHAHVAGIVHCDIKPGNVQLTDAGPKVLDFGIARRLSVSPDTQTRTSDLPAGIVGTPGYMSPEQSLGLALDGRTDVFSLGVVLFEMLAGRRPYEGVEGDRWFEPLRLVLGDAPDFSVLGPAVPRELVAILERSLRQEPDGRFGTAAELRDALRAVRPQLSRRWAWWTGLRRRGMAAAGATLAIAAVAAAGIGWRLASSPARMTPAPRATEWYVEGEKALREGAYHQASRALQRAAEIDPRHPLTWARLGEAQLELDQEALARGSLLRATALVPDRGRLEVEDRLLLEGAMALAGRDHAAALRAYTELVARHPSSAPLRMDLARAQEASNATAGALDSYARAAALDPENPAPYLRLGVLQARSQKMADAERAFARAQELYRARGRIEGVATVLYERAVMLHRMARAVEARAALERAGQLAQSVESPYLLALIAFKMCSVAGAQGQLPEAEQLAREARRHSEGLPAVYAFGLVDVGNVYLYAGRLDAAAAVFREARDRAERAGAARARARAQLALAALGVEHGRVDESIADATAALAYYEQTGFVGQQTLARTVLIRAQEKKGDLAGAERNYEALLQGATRRGVQSEIAEAHFSLCGVQLRRERYAAAVAHCDRSLTLFRALQSPYDVVHAMLRRSALFWRVGRFQDAEREIAGLFAPGSGTGDATGELRHMRQLRRAEIALAQGHDARAERIARDGLAASSDIDAAVRLEFQRVRGLALARSGRVAEAQTVMDAARAGAGELADLVLTASVELAGAEILLAAGQHEKALDAAAALAGRFRQQERYESAWIAARLATAAAERLGRADAAAHWREQAAHARKQLAAQFEAPAWQIYTHRADVKRFERKGART